MYLLKSSFFTILCNFFFTYILSIVNCFFLELGALKEISSNNFSKIVYSLLAPIFSVCSFTKKEVSAISSIASSVISIFKSSVASKATYCFISELQGSVNILFKSSLFKIFNLTLIGKRPCNSGIKSEGFEVVKAPAAINKTWWSLLLHV